MIGRGIPRDVEALAIHLYRSRARNRPPDRGWKTCPASVRAFYRGIARVALLWVRVGPHSRVANPKRGK